MGALKRRIGGALALAAGVAALEWGPAAAQPNETVLPEISVTNTRLVGGGKGARRNVAPGAGADVEAAPQIEAAAANSSGIVTNSIITGASTTVITAEDIFRSPNQSLPEILSREPGIQVTNSFGGVNGARSTIDMRGFGAAAGSNTLILVNGRRLNDNDSGGADISAIPRDSIERIEITRGNSGAVLYGDGAVGGVINIVTKAGGTQPPSARVQGGFGSFNQREGNISASGSSGQFSAYVYGGGIWSDGYRRNNALEQKNATGDFRWNNGQGTGAYFNISADDQRLGLPGARLVTLTSSQLVSDRRGATSLTDYAEKRGVNATLGVTQILWAGTELIVDGGIRQKDQEAVLFSGFKADLTTISLTPRIISEQNFGGMPGRLLAGIDLYRATYGSDRSETLNVAPYQMYSLRQSTAAAYFQQKLGVRPDTDVAFGARIQRNFFGAQDIFDANAPGGSSCFPPFGCFPNGTQGIPLDKSETQHAFHVGVEHRVTSEVAFFGRVARSFRLPNIDERIGMAPFGVPTNYDLKTQTSHDFEAGIRTNTGPVSWQISGYLMDLENELHFNPVNFTNINLDPTRRFGIENILYWKVADYLRVKAGLAYTRATFREGPFAGNDVPLVSPWTGSVAVSWDIYREYLTLDAVARFFSSRPMDNDQANFQPHIPGTTVVDLRIGGKVDKFYWSFAVQNVFDVLYFDYAIASASTFGTYNAYPLSGRAFMARAGVTF